MERWSIDKNKFSKVSDAFNIALSGDRLFLVDGGAAGDLSPPFDACKNLITAIRFEPRGKDKVVNSPSDIYIDGGLWSEDTTNILHLASVATTSSIYPPNEKFLDSFDDDYGYPPRKTVEKIRVNLRSIDSCVVAKEIPLPNFIKLDVHSAELPALEGSKNSLDCCVGLLIETWHSEVHRNQGLHFSIEEFAISRGFEVFDITCAARWHHKYNQKINASDRGQYIGSEILFIKKNVSHNLLIKKSLVLALFGFGNAAKCTLEEYPDRNVTNHIIDAINNFQNDRPTTWPSVLKSKLKNYLQS